MIEVFQVDEDAADGCPRIMAMYLRKAPSKWMATTGSANTSFRSSQSKRMSSFRETRCEDDAMSERFHIQEERVREERLSFMLRKGNFVF